MDIIIMKEEKEKHMCMYSYVPTHNFGVTTLTDTTVETQVRV